VKFPILHSECGGVAFYVTRMVADGEAVPPDVCIKLDGTHPTFGERIICGTCGKDPAPFTLGIGPGASLQ
jgi:hypothetical protein